MKVEAEVETIALEIDKKKLDREIIRALKEEAHLSSKREKKSSFPS